MTSRKFTEVKIISLVVAAAGIVVMLGWIFDVETLKRLSPEWVSMKLTTAIAFVLSGASLFFIAGAREGDFETAQVALSITATTLSLLMGTMFFSSIFGVHSGIESLFVRDAGDAMSVVPGRPSVPTMVNFILIAVAAVATTANPAAFPRRMMAVGFIIGLTGALAIAGYLMHMPLLSYYMADVNSAMAFNTGVLFVLLGAGLVRLRGGRP